jgi:hypothetical protein
MPSTPARLSAGQLVTPTIAEGKRVVHRNDGRMGVVKQVSRPWAVLHAVLLHEMRSEHGMACPDSATAVCVDGD